MIITTDQTTPTTEGGRRPPRTPGGFKSSVTCHFPSEVTHKKDGKQDYVKDTTHKNNIV